MLIPTYFHEAGVPKTGLSPTIDIYRVSDNSLVVNDGAMTEVGGGFYKYDFAAYSSAQDYVYVVDGTATLANAYRYLYGATNVDGSVADILVDTAVIGAAGAGLTAVPWNASWDAEIQSEVQDAIEVNNLDHLMKIAVADPDNMAAEVANDTVLAYLMTQDGDTTDFFSSGCSLLGLYATVGATLTHIVDNVGVHGVELTAIPWNAAWDAEVQSEVTDALNSYDPPTKAEMDAAIAAGDDAVLAAVADVPTVAEFEARTIAAANYLVEGDTLARVTLVDTCAVNSDMRGTDSAALASVCIETRLAELDAANLPSDIDGIKAKTVNLPSDPADQSAIEAAITAATSTLATATAVADLPTNAELSSALAAADDAVLAAIAALNNLSSAGAQAAAAAALAAYGAALQTSVDDLEADTIDILTVLDRAEKALINKLIITEANGTAEMFDNSNVSIGTVPAAFSSDGTYTTRKRMVPT